MAKSFKNMDKTTIGNLPVFRSEVFRTPFPAERDIGLWVDRIGEALYDSSRSRGLRVLGLYGAVYIMKGEGTFVTRTCGSSRVGEGDVMLLFPDEPHGYGPDRVWHTRWVVWGGPEAGVLRRIGYLSVRGPVVRDGLEAVSRAYEELAPVMAREDVGAVLFRKQALLRMVLDLYSASRAAGHGGRRAGDIRRAMRYIEDHCTRPLPVPELASRFSMSVTHFRRLFRHYTGRTPSRYISSMRISRAKRCLAEGMSIKAAAADVGYDDTFYFMRVFKRETGIPPGAFVRGLRSGA
jgi:AraC family transcriptional regulator of arabinose operon